jgi:hypothetical protein
MTSTSLAKIVIICDKLNFPHPKIIAAEQLKNAVTPQIIQPKVLRFGDKCKRVL